MQANLQDQQTLLKISELDLEISRTLLQQKRLRESNEIENLRNQMLELSDELIDARNRVSELESELERSESDLALVENRIIKDRNALNSTASAKDAQGIEHELVSLESRKSELEDLEIGILDELDSARTHLAALESNKVSAAEGLSNAQGQVRAQISELENKASELRQEKQKLVATLNPELALAYEAKASRALAVGRLVGRDCGACRLSITATDYDDIVAQPSDSLPLCPNCSAFLVRA